MRNPLRLLFAECMSGLLWLLPPSLELATGQETNGIETVVGND